MKSIRLLLYLSMLPTLALCQGELKDLAKMPVCSEMIEVGDSKVKDALYDAALTSYLNALNCDSKLAGQLGPKIAGVFERIRKQKETAVRNKSLAERRTREAQTALALAEKRRKEANSTTLIIRMQQAFRVDQNAARNYAIAAFDSAQTQASAQAIHSVFSNPQNHFYQGTERGQYQHLFTPNGRFSISRGVITYPSDGDYTPEPERYFRKDAFDSSEDSGCEFAEPKEGVLKLMVSDSLLVSGDWNGMLTIWRLTDCKKILELDVTCIDEAERESIFLDKYGAGKSKPAFPITNLDFSPDGKFLLATTASGGMKVWDISDMQEDSPSMTYCRSSPYWNGGGSISSTVFSWNANELIAIGNRISRITVDSAEKPAFQRFDLPCEIDNLDDNLKNLLLFPEVGYIAFSRGRSVYVYNWEEKDDLEEIIEHDEEIISLVKSKDGRDLLLGGGSGVIKWWRFESEEDDRPKEQGAFYGHKSPIEALIFHPNGNGFSSRDISGLTRTWTLNHFLAQDIFSGVHDRAITQMHLGNKANEIITAASDGAVLRWKFDQKNKVDTLVRPQNSSALQVLVDENEKILEELEKNPSKAVSLKDLKSIKNYKGIVEMEVSADRQSILLLRDDSELSLYKEGKIQVFSTDGDEITQIAMLPDGRSFYTVNADGEIYYWHSDKSAPVSRFEENVGRANDLALSPDGRFLLVSLDVSLELNTDKVSIASVWDFAKNKWIYSLAGIGDKSVDDNYGTRGVPYYKGHGDKLNLIRWSPDGKYLFTASSGSYDAIIWDAKTGQHVQDMGEELEEGGLWFFPEGNKPSFPKRTFYPITDAVFSNNSKWCLSIGEKGIQLWDRASGYPIMTLPASEKEKKASTINFSSNDQYLIVGFEDGTIERWENPYFALKK